MPFKLYDYSCTVCQKVEEHLVWNDEQVVCSDCKEPMKQEIPAPMGNVKWSENPVRNQKRKN